MEPLGSLRSIERNREKLFPILETVIFCARHNIAFRGHRDDSKYYGSQSNNVGNFQALLEFRVDSGDKILEDHFKTAPRNATYRSKSIQNEMIESCRKYIISLLKRRVIETKHRRKYARR